MLLAICNYKLIIFSSFRQLKIMDSHLRKRGRPDLQGTGHDGTGRRGCGRGRGGRRGRRSIVRTASFKKMSDGLCLAGHSLQVPIHLLIPDLCCYRRKLLFLGG